MSSTSFTYEAVFFDSNQRNGKTFLLKCDKGRDIVKASYGCIQRYLLEESLIQEGYNGSLDSVVEMIQHIIDKLTYSSVIIRDLVKNQHSYTLEELAEKIVPLNVIKPYWKLMSITIK